MVVGIYYFTHILCVSMNEENCFMKVFFFFYLLEFLLNCCGTNHQWTPETFLFNQHVSIIKIIITPHLTAYSIVLIQGFIVAISRHLCSLLSDIFLEDDAKQLTLQLKSDDRLARITRLKCFVVERRMSRFRVAIASDILFSPIVK